MTGENPGSRKHKPLTYVLCVVFSIPLAMIIGGIMIGHGAEEQTAIHGGQHGVLLGLFAILPVMLIHFSFEGDRTIRNMMYHILYWVLSLGLMGLVIGGFC